VSFLHINAGRQQRVYPVAYFRSIAAGETAEPIPTDVLLVIMAEWMEHYPGRPEDTPLPVIVAEWLEAIGAKAVQP